ncbi:DUF4397 domain-containing protein [Anaerolineales bacterium HSG24]|nr:DUF4397 domain-containing protein [Anaerolineales bacterium HSG24]
MKSFVRLTVVLGIILLVGQLSVQADGTGTGGANLRFVHASPDAPSADVYINNDRYFENIAFGSISNYVRLTPGNHLIRILPAGSPPNTPPVKEVQLSFDDNKFYSLVAVDRLAQLELLRIEDHNSPTAQSKARISFTHTSPGAPNADICVVGHNNCFITNLTFKASNIVDIGTGAYNIDIRPAGSPNVIVNLPSNNFQDGMAYTYYIVGLVNGEPRVRVINASFKTRGGPVHPPATGAILAPEIAFGLGTVLLLIGGLVWGIRWYTRY